MNFNTLFKPRTLAVIGVSLKNENHPANVIYNKNNFRLKAKVFPVNDRGGIYQGEKVYANVMEIGEKIDLAVIATRAELVPKIMTECIRVLLLPYIPGITSDLGARLSQVYRQTGKPMIAYVPHVEKYLMFVEGFQLNQIPVAHSIEETVHMAVSLKRHRKY